MVNFFSLDRRSQRKDVVPDELLSANITVEDWNRFVDDINSSFDKKNLRQQHITNVKKACERVQAEWKGKGYDDQITITFSPGSKHKPDMFHFKIEKTTADPVPDVPSTAIQRKTSE